MKDHLGDQYEATKQWSARIEDKMEQVCLHLFLQVISEMKFNQKQKCHVTDVFFTFFTWFVIIKGLSRHSAKNKSSRLFFVALY